MIERFTSVFDGEYHQIYDGDRRIACCTDQIEAGSIVAALSAAQRQPGAGETDILAATVEAQRDTEVAMLEAARPYSALREYHRGRSEAFSLVLEALAQQPAVNGAAAEVERLRHEAEIAQAALRDYYPDRDNPAALIDRIERAWHALEVALAATPPQDGPDAAEPKVGDAVQYSGRRWIVTGIERRSADGARFIICRTEASGLVRTEAFLSELVPLPGADRAGADEEG